MKLILLPGMDGTGELFAPFISALDERFEAVAVEYPTDCRLGYDDLEKVARTYIPTDEPFVLLSESFSGPIAISIAASRPANLQSLVLCCTFAQNPRKWLTSIGWILSAVPLKWVPTPVTGRLLFGSYSTPANRSRLADVLRKVDLGVLQYRLKLILVVDMVDRLSRITASSLYLRAEEDQLVKENSALLLKEHLPDLKIVSIKAPHFLLQTVPVEASVELTKFIYGNAHAL